MPYINIIIPARYKIPIGATGVYYFDTFDLYSQTGFVDNTFNFNKNVLVFEDKFFTGKKNGYVFYNHYFINDDFNQYSSGQFIPESGYCLATLTGNFKSGFSNKTISGILCKNHYLIYDNFEQYSTGILNNLSGTYISGYFSLYNFVQGIHNISGIY